MTLKKALLRGVLGAPLGVFIGYTITVLISLGWGQGWYAPVVPALTETMGSEIGAVTLQYMLSALMGFAFAFASAIWEIERWSLARQTVCHFVAITLGTLPIAWVCHWADNVPGGIWGYFGIFAIAYVVIWLVLTTAIRKKVRQVNQKLQGRS